MKKTKEPVPTANGSHKMEINMRYTEKKEKLDYLLEMIEKGRLLSLKQASDKFECSVSTIKRMISILKDDGHDILYCRNLNKFYKKNNESSKNEL